jgi:hypothetical protein
MVVWVKDLVIFEIPTQISYGKIPQPKLINAALSKLELYRR